MRHLVGWIAIAVALVGALPSLSARAATPVIFQQGSIEILAFGPLPEAIASPSNTADAQATAPASAAKPKARRYQYRTQIRPAAALNQKDLFTVSPFVHTQAMLFTYDPPALVGFYAPHIQNAVDMLAVNTQGIIQEIVPQAVPSALDSSQYTVDQPMRALLILPAGTVDTNGLRPGDRVLHKMFTVKPEQRR